MDKLTHKYIRDNFKIQEECQMVLDKKWIGEIDISFNDGLKISELADVFSDKLKEFPSEAYVMSFPYGYDGAETVEVWLDFEREETESETIRRLVQIEKQKRKKQKEYEKALKVVENHDTSGKQSIIK